MINVMDIRKAFGVLSVVAFTGGFPSYAIENYPPVDLRCEHLVDPLGVNTLEPRFSWKNTGENISVQTAYEIIVGTDSASVAGGKNIDLWKSGRIKSSTSSLVEYAGANLVPRTQAWWKVRVWNQKGKPSAWSEVARFGVGITDDAEIPLRGEYIGMAEGNGDMRSPILRSSFSYESADPGRIMAHVNSLGYHELYVNGIKASERVLSPSVSQLDKRSLIVTYDITPFLNEGENDIAIHLGQGWYKEWNFHAQYGGPLVKVEVDRVAGQSHETMLVSDSSWRVSPGGRYDNSIWFPLSFGGETVDSRVAPSDMTSVTLDKLSWTPVAVVPMDIMATPDMSGGNKIYDEISAVSIKSCEDGSFIADMGRVFTGWFSMETSEELPSGTEIRMEYSDHLNSEGVPEPQGEADVFITSGREGEVFCNKFHHHAYRFVTIKGLQKKPDTACLVGKQIHGIYEDAASFECSDADLNAVHDLLKYTMTCLTFSGYMVDCPHLERTGYGGDGNSSTMTLQTMYDVAPTYSNWLLAWGDVMDPDGSLPHVAPAGGGGGGPYWCGFIVMAPWRTWLNYGDRRMVETYYPYMKKWMGYVEAHSHNGLLKPWPDTHNRVWYLGDWLAPWGVDAGNEKSVNLVNNCFISECLSKMESCAKTLGLKDEAEMWRKRRLDLNALIHYTFYNPETCEYATGSQLDMAYPMLVGATPPELLSNVRERMLQLSRDKWNNHIGAGLVGVPIVTQWAIDERQSDFMARMLRQRDYPGYLNMIDNGATAT